VVDRSFRDQLARVAGGAVDQDCSAQTAKPPNKTHNVTTAGGGHGGVTALASVRKSGDLRLEPNVDAPLHSDFHRSRYRISRVRCNGHTPLGVDPLVMEPFDREMAQQWTGDRDTGCGWRFS
jgi:hypothetical protein